MHKLISISVIAWLILVLGCCTSSSNDRHIDKVVLMDTLESIELSFAKKELEVDPSQLVRGKIESHLKNFSPSFEAHAILYLYDKDEGYSSLIARGDDGDFMVKMDLRDGPDHLKSHKGSDIVVTVEINPVLEN